MAGVRGRAKELKGAQETVGTAMGAGARYQKKVNDVLNKLWAESYAALAWMVLPQPADDPPRAAPARHCTLLAPALVKEFCAGPALSDAVWAGLTGGRPPPHPRLRKDSLQWLERRLPFAKEFWQGEGRGVAGEVFIAASAYLQYRAAGYTQALLEEVLARIVLGVDVLKWAAGARDDISCKSLLPRVYKNAPHDAPAAPAGVDVPGETGKAETAFRLLAVCRALAQLPPHALAAFVDQVLDPLYFTEDPAKASPEEQALASPSARRRSLATAIMPYGYTSGARCPDAPALDVAFLFYFGIVERLGLRVKATDAASPKSAGGVIRTVCGNAVPRPLAVTARSQALARQEQFAIMRETKERQSAVQGKSLAKLIFAATFMSAASGHRRASPKHAAEHVELSPLLTRDASSCAGVGSQLSLTRGGSWRDRQPRHGDASQSSISNSLSHGQEDSEAGEAAAAPSGARLWEQEFLKDTPVFVPAAVGGVGTPVPPSTEEALASSATLADMPGVPYTPLSHGHAEVPRGKARTPLLRALFRTPPEPSTPPGVPSPLLAPRSPLQPLELQPVEPPSPPVAAAPVSPPLGDLREQEAVGPQLSADPLSVAMGIGRSAVVARRGSAASTARRRASAQRRASPRRRSSASQHSASQPSTVSPNERGLRYFHPQAVGAMVIDGAVGYPAGAQPDLDDTANYDPNCPAVADPSALPPPEDMVCGTAVRLHQPHDPAPSASVATLSEPRSPGVVSSDGGSRAVESDTTTRPPPSPWAASASPGAGTSASSARVTEARAGAGWGCLGGQRMEDVVGGAPLAALDKKGKPQPTFVADLVNLHGGEKVLVDKAEPPPAAPTTVATATHAEEAEGQLRSWVPPVLPHWASSQLHPSSAGGVSSGASPRSGLEPFDDASEVDIPLSEQRYFPLARPGTAPAQQGHIGIGGRGLPPPDPSHRPPPDPDAAPGGGASTPQRNRLRRRPLSSPSVVKVLPATTPQLGQRVTIAETLMHWAGVIVAVDDGADGGNGTVTVLPDARVACLISQRLEEELKDLLTHPPAEPLQGDSPLRGGLPEAALHPPVCSFDSPKAATPPMTPSPAKGPRPYPGHARVPPSIPGRGQQWGGFAVPAARLQWKGRLGWLLTRPAAPCPQEHVLVPEGWISHKDGDRPGSAATLDAPQHEVSNGAPVHPAKRRRGSHASAHGEERDVVVEASWVDGRVVLADGRGCRTEELSWRLSVASGDMWGVKAEVQRPRSARPGSAASSGASRQRVGFSADTTCHSARKGHRAADAATSGTEGEAPSWRPAVADRDGTQFPPGPQTEWMRNIVEDTAAAAVASGAAPPENKWSAQPHGQHYFRVGDPSLPWHPFTESGMKKLAVARGVATRKDLLRQHKAACDGEGLWDAAVNNPLCCSGSLSSARVGFANGMSNVFLPTTVRTQLSETWREMQRRPPSAPPPARNGDLPTVTAAPRPQSAALPPPPDATTPPPATRFTQSNAGGAPPATSQQLETPVTQDCLDQSYRNGRLMLEMAGLNLRRGEAIVASMLQGDTPSHTPQRAPLFETSFRQ
eukprot:TRINITY_DN17740_c0_g1_i1.p1 TRINITY_DN17740_c0_g1~~TRINITY_DN17740_c0_g1_i1.p1  ORF type:complete len:1804 (+),score=326.49 TRINITY_DN17740_c0_g1_i1:748-5412(+)